MSVLTDTIVGANSAGIIALAIALARTRERIAKLEGKLNGRDRPMD